jgi:hypothetical protein
MSELELFRRAHNTAHVDGLSIEKNSGQCADRSIGTSIYRYKLFILSNINLQKRAGTFKLDAVEEKIQERRHGRYVCYVEMSQTPSNFHLSHTLQA